MKCDELQERWFEAYPVEGDQIIPTKVYGKKDADDAIAELKRENENMKDAFGGTTIAYKQVCDEYEQCDKGLRATKRALWLARAERAYVITLLWNVYCYQNNCLYFRDFLNEKCNPFRDLPKKTAKEWRNLWESIDTKCRAKAEKYK